MMAQIRIRDRSGIDIPLDGDFLVYDDEGHPLDKVSATAHAVLQAFPSVSGAEVLRAFALEKDPHYVYTGLHRLIADTHRERYGDTPFAVIGELWMGKKTELKHGTVWKTQVYLHKLDRYLNSAPWDEEP
jgi:hypothetical protein